MDKNRSLRFFLEERRTIVKQWRGIVMLIVFSLFVLGCTPEKEQVEEKPMSLQAVQEKEQVQEVFGWKDTYSLIYTIGEKEQQVKVANLKEGTTKVIARFPGWIQFIDYHPKAQRYTIQWTKESGENYIDVINTDGELVEWLPFEGDMFDIQWHPSTPSLWLVTSFNEAWEADVYLYNSEEKYGTYLDDVAPFAFWYVDEITYFNEGRLTVGETSKKIVDEQIEPVQFYPLKDRLLGVFYEEKKLLFYWWDEQLEKKNEWEAAVAFDEWSVSPPVVRETKEEVEIFFATSEEVFYQYTIDKGTDELKVEEVQKLPYDCNESYCLQSDQRTIDPFNMRWIKEEE